MYFFPLYFQEVVWYNDQAQALVSLEVLVSAMRYRAKNLVSESQFP